MILRKYSGFTIIELVIVITIMAILTSVVVISLRTSQENAKTKERQDDVDAIARAFETTYHEINPDGEQPSYPQLNSYPYMGALTMMESGSKKSPTDSASNSLVNATNASTSPPSPTPSASYDKYVYQPLTATGSLCQVGSGVCVRFNLYYYNGSTYSVKESLNR